VRHVRSAGTCLQIPIDTRCHVASWQVYHFEQSSPSEFPSLPQLATERVEPLGVGRAFKTVVQEPACTRCHKFSSSTAWFRHAAAPLPSADDAQWHCRILTNPVPLHAGA